MSAWAIWHLVAQKLQQHCHKCLAIYTFFAMAKFKQACFAHDLSKKFQIFTAVHNSMFKIQQRSYFFIF